MEMIYDNVNSANNKSSHYMGKQVTSSKWTKVLLIVLGVSLVLALGGLCVLGFMLSSASDSERELLDKYQRVKNCLSSCTEFTASEFLTPSCKPCEDGWTPRRGKCYFFSSVKQTWFESRDSCVASEAHLVTINHTEVQDFLVSKISETHWIGLNDLEVEGHWVWMNNQTLRETPLKFWFKKKSGEYEPDNWSGDDASGEDCACMGYENVFLNYWFDASCEYKKKYICEKTFSSTFTDDN
ncbi:unnamed protein product [Leuciscus chuanchicus]